MKLYTFDPAPNPQRLKLFIDFKDCLIKRVPLDSPKAIF